MTREEAIKIGLEKGTNKGYGDLSGVVPELVTTIYNHHEAELKQAYIDGSNNNHQAVLGLLKRRMEVKGTTHEERCVLQEVYESIGGK